jgi:hypothetical protein
MMFLFPTKPCYLLGNEQKIINRKKELNVVSTKVLQPERSHSVHDITLLAPTEPDYLLCHRVENIKQAKGNECSQYKITTADAAVMIHTDCTHFLRPV